MTENEAIEIIENFPEWNLDDLWLAGDEMGELVQTKSIIIRNCRKALVN